MSWHQSSAARRWIEISVDVTTLQSLVGGPVLQLTVIYGKRLAVLLTL